MPRQQFEQQRRLLPVENTPIAKRASVLEKAADYLEQNVEEIAQGLTEEEGETWRRVRAKYCAQLKRYGFTL